MATILDKDLTRESTVKANDREIQVTLTADQKISMKLKGMKSGIVTITIAELYEQISGGTQVKEELGQCVQVDVQAKPKKEDGAFMVSLYDLRNLSSISEFDYQTKCKFDGLLESLISEKKK